MKALISWLSPLMLLSPNSLAAEAPISGEVQAMNCLVGTWKGHGTLEMGDQKVAIYASINCGWSVGKHAVACVARFTGIPGVAVYEENDLFGYDPGEKMYHWFAVTNAGETHDHTMSLTHSNVLTWNWAGKIEGQSAMETIVMNFDPNHQKFSFVSTTTVGGAMTAKLGASLVRGT